MGEDSSEPQSAMCERHVIDPHQSVKTCPCFNDLQHQDRAGKPISLSYDKHGYEQEGDGYRCCACQTLYLPLVPATPKHVVGDSTARMMTQRIMSDCSPEEVAAFLAENGLNLDTVLSKD